MSSRAAFYQIGTLERIKSHLEEAAKKYAKAAAFESELQLRVQNLADGAPEAERLKTELEEYHQIVKALAAREEDCRAREREVRASPEFRMITSMRQDKRRPTRADISGVWTSGPNLSGYNMELEQRGETVRGRGFQWGCGAMFDFFQVRGVYHGSILSLTLDYQSEDMPNRTYRYCRKGRRLRFADLHGKREQRIIPVVNLR